MKNIIILHFLAFTSPAFAQFQFSENRIIDECDYCNYIYCGSADLDNDGDADILVYDRYRQRSRIFFNNGQGNFTETSTNIQEGYRGFKWIDFDQDGDIDVFVEPDIFYKDAKTLPNLYFKNDGQGKFSTPVEIEDFYKGHFLDMDNDGDLDIMDPYVPLWYQNDGDQNYAIQTLDTIEGIFTLHEKPLDYDGDGDVDIYAQQENSLIRYENDGQGNFIKQEDLTFQFEEYEYRRVIDHDQDGDFDIAYFPYGSAPFFYDNDGAGNFQKQAALPFPPIGRGDYSFMDMNGDDKVDLIFVSFDEVPNYRWYKNEGQGVFSRDYQILQGEKPDFFHHNAQAIDVDQDGLTDIVNGNPFDGLYWYKNNGKDEFIVKEIYSSPDYAIHSLTVGDLDNDTEMDVVVLVHQRPIGSELYWYKNNNNGTSFSKELIARDGMIAADVEVADFDGDNNLDILAAYQHDGGIVLYKNNGVGKFTRSVVVAASLYTVKLVTKDIDQDGDVDFVSDGENRLYWYENDGSGKFTPRIIDITGFGGPNYYDVADFDLDGHLDICLLRYDQIIREPAISWYRNDGTNQFSEPIFIGQHNFPGGAFAKDLNNDGLEDIVVLDINEASWYVNEGNGTFSNAIDIETQEGFFTAPYDLFGDDSILFSDIDGDQDLDILVNGQDRTIYWLMNDGQGGFSEQLPIVPQSSYLRAVADMNKDGLLDFVSAWQEELVWNSNRLPTSLQSFPENTSVTVFPNPFTNQVTFRSSKELPDPMQLRIFSSMGNLLLSTTLQVNNSITLPIFVTGTYYYELIDTEGKSLAKGKLVKVME